MTIAAIDSTITYVKRAKQIHAAAADAKNLQREPKGRFPRPAARRLCRFVRQLPLRRAPLSGASQSMGSPYWSCGDRDWFTLHADLRSAVPIWTKCRTWQIISQLGLPLATNKSTSWATNSLISRVVSNAAGHADRDLRKIPSRIVYPSTNGPTLSTAEPRAAIGRVTSSFVSAHGRCSFCMSANPATLAARLAGKTAAETISVMLAVFARIEPALRKAITFDNDTAFAQHALLRTMRAMTTWFCDAYASWQKGGVENANGRLRRWLPRQIDIDQCPTKKFRTSSSPPISARKCLGFKTLFQAILKELGKDVQIRFA